ncbi:ABC transporter permease subunit [Bacillota bacterium LX-D]|nr:ABC transporter permease subunit [Bacillota bacterium LX-D]
MKTINKKIINAVNIFFLLLVLSELIPAKAMPAESNYLLGLAVIIEIIYIANLIRNKNKEKVQACGDVAALILAFLWLWELGTAKLGILDKFLYPAPGVVLKLFIQEFPFLLKGLLNSIQLLAGGYLLALLVAVPLALVIGWRRRLYQAAKPLTKVLGPIPPIVYIPYAIAILPTFKASSIFVIFIGAFWPVFINTLNGVFNIEKRIIDAARVLNVGEREMLFKVILPGALPSMLSGATIGLVFSFILLTSAEMIGATSGIGWYVKYFSDFADYPRVVVGILFMGLVVTVITYFFDQAERFLLRWRR